MTGPIEPVAASRTNVLAIVSLTSGIFGLTFMPLLGGLIAVITGHLSRKEIHTSGEAGDGLAKGGLVTGYIGLAFAVVGLVIYGIFMAIFAMTGNMMDPYP
ncbi:hypothetical protein M2119_000578 [Aurantimicrobium minutum]|uniref:DUF4190 domain-containing protein n=1 Tax=Aurantimicrobium minutum TaxID=708131 RepID=UPI002474ACBD|nr:DUF4190 domain-containing protein [Aurantimicrobium minutum]MDH6532341.1 hypothetical protein [Aurantimicrobium minutum]